MCKGVYQDIYIEREMLNGELNRMSVTNSEKELRDMFDFAINRVITLRNLNMQRLKEGELK